MVNQKMDEEVNSYPLDELQKLYKQRVTELAEAKKALVRLEKESRNISKYNQDLLNQVKLLNAKLNLHQQVSGVVMTSTMVSVETQTDLSFFEKTNNDCGEDDSEDEEVIEMDTPGQKFISTHVNGQAFKSSWINEVKDGSKAKTIADLVREAAEETATVNDYVYDSKTKTYYSQSTGWYYYPERELFFDPRSRNYYKYNVQQKSYEFYSSLDSNNVKSDRSKRSRRKRIKRNEEPEEAAEDGAEEGELSASEDEDEDSLIEIDSDDDIVTDDDVSNTSNHRLGDVDSTDFSCIRMIVRQSDSLDEGSLHLVSYKGAKVGNDDSCEVYITDESVSKLHAEITYESTSRTYRLSDCQSEEGTLLNGVRLKTDQQYELTHGDILTFGTSEFLLHMHSGKDVTCIHCEPGCVQANLKLVQKEAEQRTETADSFKERRRQLNRLRKKYGINGFIQEPDVQTPEGYSDRAEKRRQTVGSDNPYEKTQEGTTLDKPLAQVNKGYQLLQKIGWQEGQSLGKSSKNGLKEPIPVEVRPDKAGLGFGTFTTPSHT